MFNKIKLRRFKTISLLRAVTLMLMTGILVLMGINIISKSGDRTKISTSDETLEEQKVEQREEIFYIEDQKGNLVLESKADRQYLGDDGFYHLEGNVLIKFLKRAEGEDIVLNGDEVLHDQEENRFILLGKAQITFKDLDIRSSSLEYESDQHVIKTDQRVFFSSDRIKGHGEALVCWEKRKEFKIKNNVYLELIQDKERSKVIQVRGDELFYTQKWGNGYVQGKVKLEFSENTVFTERMEFYLPPNKEFLRSLILKGEVRADLSLNPSSQEAGQKDRYEARADEVFVRFFKYLDTPQRIEAEGNCTVHSINSGLGFDQIGSHQFAVYFNRQGGIEKFFGTHEVLIEQKEETHIRQIRGSEFRLDSSKEVLTVFGGEVQQAQISSRDYDISADEIISPLNSKNLVAQGTIRGVFRQSDPSETGIGIFSSLQPVYVSAENMRYFRDLDRFVFEDDVRMWQGQEMLKSEELVIKKERSGMSASQGVQTVLQTTNNKGKEEKIQISSENMEFDPRDNMIKYQLDCRMEMGEVELTSGSLSIQMQRDSNEVKSITALDSVKVFMGEYEGRGERAVYNLDNESVVLTENPVLLEENGGKTQGDKLTFRMSDDRIIVENRGDERSVTVIKK
ncbi:MAG: hypothetical protein GF421_01830 [Candidatus Aminicenantes bacterium]|nr:hypothetical protein [Candidatus Aminicenantes bacterium]